MPLRMHGDQAELRWSYHRAAALGPWEYTSTHGTREEPTPIVREFAAVVRECSPLALRQRPLTLVLPRPKGVVWRFPVETLVVLPGEQGGPTRIAATLGQKESSHVTVRPSGNSAP